MSTDSYDKIRLKSAPKQYKLKAGPTGRQRLETRIAKLVIDLGRFLRKDLSEDDRAWALRMQIRLRPPRPVEEELEMLRGVIEAAKTALDPPTHQTVPYEWTNTKD